MGFPRSKYVHDGEVGVYHCFGRCVRRAFLCGIDPVTRKDYSYRKKWILDRLKYLASVFAIEVCAYAILWNHYHTILRTRPDIVAGWSDREVAIRWLQLFPKNRGTQTFTEKDICALVNRPKRIALLRKRLCSISWFMGQLNEFIARAANKEDEVTGRFWESRFKCKALIDVAGIATGMAYVDLNLIRAGLAATPEESDFTSIQERIRAWQKDNSTQMPPDTIKDEASWLCPISDTADRRGILPMTELEYFDLVDRSGRIIRSDKCGAIDADLSPILLRIGANPETWPDVVSNFGSKFCLAAGLLSSLRTFADRLGRRWLKGFTLARSAFIS